LTLTTNTIIRMQLNQHEVHVWSADLTLSPEQEKIKLTLLSKDEFERAKRFHFPIHQRRFIAARSTLREILSLYTHVAPQTIVFAYNEHHKPYLAVPDNTQINFNLAHSENIAVFALMLNSAVGIDIEKIQLDDKSALAKRFFTLQENQDLMQLPDQEKIPGFYQLWSRKEVLIKAIGKGLSIPLSSFSLSVNHPHETILLEGERWSVRSLSIHPDFQAALASNQFINTISYWRFFNHKPKLDTVSRL
jgi:4'-phosphopantetheinyl transferase